MLNIGLLLVMFVYSNFAFRIMFLSIHVWTCDFIFINEVDLSFDGLCNIMRN